MQPDTVEILEGGELILYEQPAPMTLFARISGHEHITAEGWTTLSGMLGVVPVVVWTRPNETNDGFVARVEARLLDGRVVGAAESECSRTERKWKTADLDARQGS